MKFNLLNLKTLLLFSGIVIGFAGYTSASDYNSDNIGSTKYSDDSSLQLNSSKPSKKKYRSQFEFDNKDEEKLCYGPNCKNKRKYYNDNYDVKRNKYKENFNSENKPCIGEECYSNSSSNIALDGSDDYSDYNYGNFDYLDDFEKEFDDGLSNNQGLVLDSNGTFMEYSSRTVMTQQGNNPMQVKQKIRGRTQTPEKRTKLIVDSEGDSDNGIKTNKYDATMISKSGTCTKKRDTWNRPISNFNDRTDCKRKNAILSDGGKQFGEELITKNMLNEQSKNRLPIDNKRIKSNNKQLPDNNYYNRYNNRENLNRNIYKTSYNVDDSSKNSFMEEDVE